MSRNLLRLAKTTKSSADDKQFPIQQMEYLEKAGDGAMLFPYGYHGNIPPEFLMVAASVQDHPDNRVALGCLPEKRPTLKEGEVAFYHPPTDAFVIWRENGDLDIETTGDINIKATNINITGDLNVTGTVKANGKVIDDTHGHAQGVDSGGSTEQNISGVL